MDDVVDRVHPGTEFPLSLSLPSKPRERLLLHFPPKPRSRNNGGGRGGEQHEGGVQGLHRGGPEGGGHGGGGGRGGAQGPRRDGGGGGGGRRRAREEPLPLVRSLHAGEDEGELQLLHPPLPTRIGERIPAPLRFVGFVMRLRFDPGLGLNFGFLGFGVLGVWDFVVIFRVDVN